MQNELESLGLGGTEKPQKQSLYKRFKVFLNKVRILFIYVNILKMNRENLEKEYNIRIDDVYRMYTVINVPPETMSLLAMKDNKFHMVFQQEVLSQITNYIKAISNFLKSLGMSEEWYGITEMIEIDQMNYKVVISFSFFNTVKIANGILITSIVGGAGILGLVIWYLNQLF